MINTKTIRQVMFNTTLRRRFVANEIELVYDNKPIHRLDWRQHERRYLCLFKDGTEKKLLETTELIIVENNHANQ